ncbi:hypothetical protein JFK97_19140 [Chromobacterium phragmitis]|uniref:hypothetical protein n=1 Tax=Chromobacterium amazonense TaxID=1382803 RepID=UPI0021B706B9|nr:hypothetical protein [Chromobacterium amazonense]MBM2886509.1 hypothetical protein [Chromobacterium amazonense]
MNELDEYLATMDHKAAMQRMDAAIADVDLITQKFLRGELDREGVAAELLAMVTRYGNK